MSDQEIVISIIEDMGEALEAFGQPKMTGKVWGTLYLKGDMTQEQLAKELSSGASSISQSLAVLEILGMIRKVSKDGRKNIYSAVSCNEDMLKKKLENALNVYIHPMRESLSEKSSKIKDKELKKRVELLKSRYSKSAQFFELLVKMIR